MVTQKTLTVVASAVGKQQRAIAVGLAINEVTFIVFDPGLFFFFFLAPPPTYGPAALAVKRAVAP